MKTMVLPLHSVCLASLTNGGGETSDSRSSSASRLCGSWKKSTKASATTGPTPWTDDSSSSPPSDIAARRNSSIVPKHFKRSRAVTMPTWRMPSPNRKRGPSGWRLASIAARRLSTDFSFQPSRPSNSSRWLRSRKMSAGELSQPSSMNSAIDFSPSPSMSSAPRDDEMAQPLEALRGADQAAGAADVDLAFLGDGFGCRIGTAVGNS